MEQLKVAAGWLKLYTAEGLHLVLLAVALLYIILYEKEKMRRVLFAGYALLFFLLYFCPLTVWGMGKLIGTLVYWRMLWLLPAPVIIAYGMVMACRRAAAGWKRTGVTVIFALAICLMGQNIYLQNTPFTEAANLQKVPAQAASVCATIRENCAPDENTMVASPEELTWYIRQYDAGIEQVYGRRDRARAGGKRIRRQLLKDKIYPDVLCRDAREIGCRYIVLTDKGKRVRLMAAQGFEVIGRVDNYVIYKDMQS